MELYAALAGGTDKPHGDTGFKGLGDNGRLAVTGKAFDANLLCVHHGFRMLLEVIDEPADAPLPGAEGAPLVRLARLTFIGQTNDA